MVLLGQKKGPYDRSPPPWCGEYLSINGRGREGRAGKWQDSVQASKQAGSPASRVHAQCAVADETVVHPAGQVLVPLRHTWPHNTHGAAWIHGGHPSQLQPGPGTSASPCEQASSPMKMLPCWAWESTFTSQ